VDGEQGLLRVGEVAALTGLSPRAVRMYEQLGLLGPPARTSAGYRLYGGMALAQLVRIQRLRRLGLGLRQMHDVLDPAVPVSVDAALAMVRDDLEVQVQRLQAVGAAIDEVQASAAWGRGDPAWQRLLATVADQGSAGQEDIDTAGTVDLPLPAVTMTRLRELADHPGWAALSGRLAALRDAGWRDQQISDIADELAAIVPVEILPDELTGPEGFALLVGRRASPAQVRCLLEAGHRARRSGPAAPGATRRR
jgi:DNA-binding transcriptional MerR regulator